jgi:hypothetical protein
MSSRSLPAQFYERRKNSRPNVDTGEGGSSNPPPPRATKKTVHRDFPRGRMHIDTEIEEEEEHIVSSSEDDDVEDETYRISPRAARRAARRVASDDDEDEEMEDIEDEPMR